MRDVPAKMNGMKPEFFSDRRFRPKPFFEVLVGGLPVLPIGRNGVYGAGFGTEIVNIERF